MDGTLTTASGASQFQLKRENIELIDLVFEYTRQTSLADWSTVGALYVIWVVYPFE